MNALSLLLTVKQSSLPSNLDDMFFLTAAFFLLQDKFHIILHGSDTLAFTSSFIANLFWDKNIVLTASDKPIEDNSANGISNFDEALRHIKKGEKGVFVSYDGIFPADTITSADGLDKFRQTGKAQPKFKNPCLAPKNI